MSLKKAELLIDLKKLPPSIPFELVKQLTPDDINGTPVVLRRGAIHYTLGKIDKVRIGKDKIHGEAQINLTGHLEFEPELDEAGKVIGIKFKKFVYV